MDVHTWPHSYYLMRQFNAVGVWGKVPQEYQLCRCGRKINDLMEEVTGSSILFILHALYATFQL